MKRKLALILALTMLITAFAACGSPETSEPTTQQPTDSGSGSAATETPADSSENVETIKFTFFDEDANRDRPWNTAIALEITRLTGVELELIRPVGGADVTIPLWTASGEYPDLIYGKGTGTTQLLDANALIRLDDYIENSTWAKDFYGTLLGRMRVSEENPHFYTVGAYPISQPNWEPSSEMGVQLAVLEHFGYPEIRTIHDVEQLIVDYIAEFPEIDGRPHFGFSLNNADGWRYIIDLGNPSGFIAGYPDHGEWIINENTLEASIKYFDPGVKEYFKWLNGIHDQGLIDPDSWTQTHDDWVAKIANGQVLAVVSPNWMLDEPEQALRANGMPERTYARMPINLTANTVSHIRYDFGWSGSWGVGITISNENPDRAWEFLDWMHSDESQILRAWGIEGVHYTYEGGKRVEDPEVRRLRVEDPDYGNSQGMDWVYPFPERGFGQLDPSGNTYRTETPESIIENYSEPAKRALAAYGVDMWADLFPPPESFAPSRVGAAWQIEIPLGSTINEYAHMVQQTLMPRMIPLAVRAAPDQFEARWQDFINAIEAENSDAMHAEFTELVRATARMFGTD